MVYKIKRKTEKQKLNKSFDIINKEEKKLWKIKRRTKFEKDKLLYINDIYKGRISPTNINKFASYL
jgi:hypothetical protein